MNPLMENFRFIHLFSIFALALSLLQIGCSDPQKQARKSLEEKGYQADVRNLMIAAAAGDTESIDLFMAAGVPIDATDKAGNTALIKAASAGHTQTVEKILGIGADPRHQNDSGRDALIAASAKGFDGVARMLVSRGADVTIRDSEGWSALSVAAYNGHAEAVSLPSSTAAAEELDDALLVASFSGDSEVINTLLSQGANINARSPENKTPLMISAENGKLDAVRILLQNQANPYATDGNQMTAANLAKQSGFEEIESLILSPDSWGSSPQGEMVMEEMSDAQRALKLEGINETLVATADENKRPAPGEATGSEEQASVMTGVPAPTTGNETIPLATSNVVKEDIAASSSAVRDYSAARNLREEARSKPIVPLNGSTIHATKPRQAPVKSMVLAAYHEEPLPIVVSDVEGSKAEVRRLNETATSETIAVESGSVIPGTNYKVQEVTRKFVSSKEGKGRMVDVSRVTVENTQTGQTHLLVKDVAGNSSDTYAILTSPESQYRYVVKTGDVFRTTEPGIGEKEYQILDIRASGVVMKDLKTEEVLTVARDGVIAP